MSLSLEAVFELRGFAEAADLIEMLVSGYPAAATMSASRSERGPRTELRLLVAPLRREHLPSTHVYVGDGELSVGAVANHDLTRLDLVGLVQSEEEAERWLGRLPDDPRFVQARVYESEYDYWQNASDPLEFTVKGRSIEGLRMVSNGLPPPLEQMEVDTSNNPGRWRLRDGYVESIGSPMWLGSRLLQITRCRLDAVQALPWLTFEQTPRHVKIRRKAGPFTTADPESSTQQDALRAALYPALSGT